MLITHLSISPPLIIITVRFCTIFLPSFPFKINYYTKSFPLFVYYFLILSSPNVSLNNFIAISAYIFWGSNSFWHHFTSLAKKEYHLTSTPRCQTSPSLTLLFCHNVKEIKAMGKAVEHLKSSSAQFMSVCKATTTQQVQANSIKLNRGNPIWRKISLHFATPEWCTAISSPELPLMAKLQWS